MTDELCESAEPTCTTPRPDEPLNDSKADRTAVRTFAPELPDGHDSQFYQPSAQSVRRELHWLEILNFSGQIILAIVGVIAACIYGYELKEMRRTNELTQQSERDQVKMQQNQMQMDEAAQLLIDNAIISDFQSGKPTVSLSFKNTGRTAVMGGVITTNAAIIGPPGPAANEINAVEVSFHNQAPDLLVTPLTKLYSQTTRNQPMILAGPVFSRKNIRQVLAGDKRLIVFGTYTYIDIFDKPHSDRYCLAYYRPANTFSEQNLKKTYLLNLINRAPRDEGSEEDDEVLKKTITEAVRSIPVPPESMNFCLAGND